MKDIALSPQVLAALDFARQLSESSKSLVSPLETTREFYKRMAVMAGEPEAVFQVEDRWIDGPEGKIAIRIYRPSGRTNLPITLFFHGGWFITGGLDTHDRPLRALANASESAVIAVDYRLAPEHPFPAAVNDAYNAFLWVVDNAESLDLDADRIAVAGDSAGGNIAAVIARKARLQVRFQVLLYPVTDTSFSTGSWQEFAEGPVVTKAVAQEAWAMYIPDGQDLKDPDVAPLRAEGLEGLAPALVIVGGYDPLRDEGLAYAEKLRNAGVSVREHVYPDMPHGFFQMGGFIDAGKDAIAETGNAIRQALKNSQQ